MSQSKLYNEILSVAKQENWKMADFQKVGEGDTAIAIHSFKNGETSVAYKNSPAFLNDPAISLSNAGNKIGFWLTEESGEKSLYIINLKSKNMDKLVTLPHGYGISWSPDNMQIAFVGHLTKEDFLNNTPALCIIDIYKKDIKIIAKHNVGYLTNQAWSPDGNEIVYVTGDGNITSFVFSNNTIRKITKGDFPVWSPAGNFIAYLDVDKNNLVVISNDGKEKKVLTETKTILSSITPPDVRGNITAPIYWLPNGEYLLYGRYVKLGAEAGWPFVIKISTKEEEQMPDFLWAFSSWSIGKEQKDNDPHLVKRFLS